MSLIKKSDVKNHFAARRHKRHQLNRSPSEPDATGFSGIDPVAYDASRSPSSHDFVQEHSATSATDAPNHQPRAVVDTGVHRLTKSARL